MVKNEYAGGGVGDLSPFETWPELWVINESEFAAAKLLVDQLQQDQEGDIFCPHCGEENGSSFRICWKCGGSLF